MPRKKHSDTCAYVCCAICAISHGEIYPHRYKMSPIIIHFFASKYFTKSYNAFLYACKYPALNSRPS